MERKETSLKQLKDQLNSLKPQPSADIDLADYNSYQFSRTMKQILPMMKDNETVGKTLLRVQNNEVLPRTSSTRDISYRKDIPSLKSSRASQKSERRISKIPTKIEDSSHGTGTSHEKHRRAESVNLIQSSNTSINKVYPTNIKHLEKLVKFTLPNHRNIGGGRACSRESWLNNNALLSPKFQSAYDTRKTPQEILDEENLMHQLEVFYKKNTDFTYSVVKKSALESNMFSKKRVTLEGMIKAKNSLKDNKNNYIHELNTIFTKGEDNKQRN